MNRLTFLWDPIFVFWRSSDLPTTVHAFIVEGDLFFSRFPPCRLTSICAYTRYWRELFKRHVLAREDAPWLSSIPNTRYLDQSRTLFVRHPWVAFLVLRVLNELQDVPNIKEGLVRGQYTVPRGSANITGTSVRTNETPTKLEACKTEIVSYSLCLMPNDFIVKTKRTVTTAKLSNEWMPVFL